MPANLWKKRPARPPANLWKKNPARYAHGRPSPQLSHMGSLSQSREGSPTPHPPGHPLPPGGPRHQAQLAAPCFASSFPPAPGSRWAATEQLQAHLAGGRLIALHSSNLRLSPTCRCPLLMPAYIPPAPYLPPSLPAPPGASGAPEIAFQRFPFQRCRVPEMAFQRCPTACAPLHGNLAPNYATRQPMPPASAPQAPAGGGGGCAPGGRRWR